jgi:hypothetical protein
MTADARSIALAYLEAHATKDVDSLARLFTAGIRFISPNRTMTGAATLIATIPRLSAVHLRNDVRQVYVHGDDVCVVYDFVTDTSTGIIPTVEWLRLKAGRIASISVSFDHVPWNTVMEELLWREPTTR